MEGISDLKYLRKVDLRNNLISSLPTIEKMKTMHKKIKTFYIAKNPFAIMRVVSLSHQILIVRRESVKTM